jgi:hypothetical protein
MIGAVGLLALGGCDVLSDPAYWNATGVYGAGNGYDPTPCTYDYNGNPSPGCYDYLFEDDQGNPLPPVAQPYDEGETEGEPEKDAKEAALATVEAAITAGRV